MFEKSRPQFGLRMLLLAVFVASLFFASVAAAGLLGAYAFLIILGALLVVAGVWMKRRTTRNAGASMIIALLCSFPFVFSTAHWSGSGTFVVAVNVVDADTGQPIPGASVELYDHYIKEPVSSYRTDISGRAAVSARFFVGGSSGLLEETGSINLGSHRIEVQRDGYTPMQAWLREFTGSSCDLYAESIPAVTIELKADTQSCAPQKGRCNITQSEKALMRRNEASGIGLAGRSLSPLQSPKTSRQTVLKTGYTSSGR